MQMPVLAGEEYLKKQRFLRRGSKLGIMFYKTIAVTCCIIVILERRLAETRPTKVTDPACDNITTTQYVMYNNSKHVYM